MSNVQYILCLLVSVHIPTMLRDLLFILSHTIPYPHTYMYHTHPTHITHPPHISHPLHTYHTLHTYHPTQPPP